MSHRLTLHPILLEADWPMPYKFTVYPEPYEPLKISVLEDGESVRLEASLPVKGVVLDVEGEEAQWSDQCIVRPSFSQWICRAALMFSVRTCDRTSRPETPRSSRLRASRAARSRPGTSATEPLKSRYGNANTSGGGGLAFA